MAPRKHSGKRGELRPLPPQLDRALGRPIRFCPVLTRLCKSLNAGLMLSQALYWSRITDDPDGWFYKTAAGWQQETSLTAKQQESARRALRRSPFWEEERRGVTGTLHFRVDQDELLRALAALSISREAGSLDSTKPQNKTRSSESFRFYEWEKHNKEAESTPETSSRSTAETTDPITPTPLSSEEDDSDEPGRHPEWSHLLNVCWMAFKMDLNDAPLVSKSLTDDWDRCFRNAWVIDCTDGVVRLGAENPNWTQEGVIKYEKRLKAAFSQGLGKPVAAFKVLGARPRTGPS